MTTITLSIKKTEGEETVIKRVQHEIEKIKLWQFTMTLKHVKDILSALNEDGSVGELFTTVFDEKDQIDPENFKPEQVEDLLKEADNKFLLKAVESFQSLAVKVPDHAFNLLATISGIERSVLDEQDFETILDIYDAVLEVNDIERLIERLKKSLGATKTRLKFLQKRKEATAE